MGQWAAEKHLRTPGTIAQRAQRLGLTLGDSIAVNSELYSLSLSGESLRTGSLNVMSWFLDRYEVDRKFRR